MWDVLVLTAGSEVQKKDFELQMERIPWQAYARTYLVVADYPEGVRIGSGGATMEVLHILHQSNSFNGSFSSSHILLFHSGGLSQRMPHLSAFGKIFARLTNGKTILETKLELYRTLSTFLLPGVLISASDVIEDVSAFKGPKKNCDVILFAHESTINVAKQHGVYVMNSYQLRSVLQKPSEKEMREHGAVREDDTVLTDSMMWFSHSVCEELRTAYEGQRPIHIELCAYSDFLRSLGTRPVLDYIEKSMGEMKEWRQMCKKIFENKSVSIALLGSESFFHFGTVCEFLEHVAPNSRFGRKFFQSQVSNMMYSRKNDLKVAPTSVVEFCDVRGTVGENSFLSGLQSSQRVEFPENVLVFTIAIVGGFVTALLPIDADFKKVERSLIWMGVPTQCKCLSLWDAPIFSVASTREESLQKTLRMLRDESLLAVNPQSISISNAVRKKDVEELLKWRDDMIHSNK